MTTMLQHGVPPPSLHPFFSIFSKKTFKNFLLELSEKFPYSKDLEKFLFFQEIVIRFCDEPLQCISLDQSNHPSNDCNDKIKHPTTPTITPITRFLFTPPPSPFPSPLLVQNCVTNTESEFGP